MKEEWINDFSVSWIDITIISILIYRNQKAINLLVVYKEMNVGYEYVCHKYDTNENQIVRR